MKIINYILIIFTVSITLACSKKNYNKPETAVKPVKKEVILPPNLKKLQTTEDFNAKEYTYNSLTLKIPDAFQKKEENTFFEENGTNLSIIKEDTSGSLGEYIENNYKKLKADYLNTIKEVEDLNINNKLARHVKYIIDRKKYLIQIESILIKQGNTIYSVIISGKKKHINKLIPTINNIFSTIKIKDN